MLEGSNISPQAVLVLPTQRHDSGSHCPRNPVSIWNQEAGTWPRLLLPWKPFPGHF